MHGWPLSVCPYVSPTPGFKSRTEGHRKLKFGRKEAHDTGDLWPHLQIERSKVKVTMLLNAVIENQPYPGRPTNVKRGIPMEYDDPHH